MAYVKRTRLLTVEKRDAPHKTSASIRLRTQIALLRHAMANTKNAQLLHRYAAELAPLLRRLEMAERGKGDAG